MKKNVENGKGSFQALIEGFAKDHHLKIVLHFPHSSLAVPESFWEDVEIERDYFRYINFKMSDLHLLELFEDWGGEKVVAPYSRLFVDVEKYWDDEKEIMAQYGMGAIYAKDVFGRPLHKRSDAFVSEAKAYYDEHHERLSKACDVEEDVLLLDIHSFNADMAKTFVPEGDFPDLCIGVNDDDSRNEELLQKIAVWNEKNKAFRYEINYPYSGSILPNRRRKGQRIYSLMLEWNKGWYL